MRERITDKLTFRLSKTVLMAVMFCALALATAAPDIAFAHGGGGGGGHDGEPEQQETATERQLSQKDKQKLFWSKQKMNKAYNKLIRHQEYMKTKIHSPKTYNYSSEQLVADMNEEEKLQKELAARQEEVKKLCSEMDVKPPTEATLVRPSVLTAADSIAAQHLQSEKTALDLIKNSFNQGNAFDVKTADTIAGTTDTHGDTPGGSGIHYSQRFSPSNKNNKDYDPLDYSYEEEWLDD